MSMLADVTAPNAPFFSSTAGVITLLMLGALVTFAFTYVPAKFKEAREAQRENQKFNERQLQILTALKEQVAPANRPGLVERMGEVEKAASELRAEFEAHKGYTKEKVDDLLRRINGSRATDRSDGE